jgi:gluconolactonase
MMTFAAPELTAHVFARLPERFRLAGRPSDWTVGKDRSDLHSFLEGPAVDRDGNLYVVDIPFGRIFRIGPDGSFELFVEYDGEPNGLAIHRDGTLYVADHRRGLLTIDPRTREVRTRLARVRREGFKGLNDLTFAANGDLYFTDQGQTALHDPTGRVYRLSATDELTCLIDNVPSPNGLALAPGDRLLYLAATRANQIWRIPLHADGSIFKVNLFLQLQGGLTGPDGLAVDEQGNLVVCHCGLGTVWVFSRTGETLYRIRSQTGIDTSNAAFGGPDNRTLYVTESESGSILAVPLPVPGRTLFSHA